MTMPCTALLKMNAVNVAMGTTLTASKVGGRCKLLIRVREESRAIFLLSVAATIFLSFLNAGMVYESVNVIPSEPDYNSEHFLGIVSAYTSSNVSAVPERALPVQLLSVQNESSATRMSNSNSRALDVPMFKTNMTRNILFVHVGKAGGETIKSILSAGCQSRKNKRRKNQCLEHLPNSRISDTVKSYFHCFSMPSGAAMDATSYLYNLRHPVDRTISWYRYVSPKNCHQEDPKSPSCGTAWAMNQNPDSGWETEFFGRCFPTVEDWAQALATTTATSTLAVAPSNSTADTSNRTDCSELAWSSLAGEISIDKHPVAAHMVANFNHYTEKTITRFPLKEVLVVRTEHMWQDLGNLDQLMGGDGAFGHLHGSSVTHGSENHKDRRPISPAGAKMFCCALQGELRIFQDLLNRATNLDAESKLESSFTTMTRCGVKSWEDLQKQCDSLVSRPRVAV
jgi:hypothetical protein